jgi:hypothetical protein
MIKVKIPCVKCGVLILERTARRHEGRCRRCAAQLNGPPPADFELPSELVSRLAAMNKYLNHYRTLAWRRGLDFFHEYVDLLEQNHRLYLEWAPRLQAFAEKCRADNPPPPEESLSDYQRAQRKLIEDLMEATAACKGQSRGSVELCSMPSFVMLIAERIFPRGASERVFLTRQEMKQWEQIYFHPKGLRDFNWFNNYWWEVYDASELREYFRRASALKWNPNDVPAGETPFLLSFGCYFGPLASRAKVDLWTWNGQEAKFIRNVSHVIS